MVRVFVGRVTVLGSIGSGGRDRCSYRTVVTVVTFSFTVSVSLIMMWCNRVSLGIPVVVVALPLLCVTFDSTSITLEGLVDGIDYDWSDKVSVVAVLVGVVSLCLCSMWSTV